MPVPAVWQCCPCSLGATQPALPRALPAPSKPRPFPEQGIGIFRALRELLGGCASAGGADGSELPLDVTVAVWHWEQAGVALGPCAEQGGMGSCASLGQSLGMKRSRCLDFGFYSNSFRVSASPGA